MAVPRIALVGANGMLGRDVVAAFAHGHTVITSELGAGDLPADLLAPASLASVLSSAQPDAVVNCAAYTNVERAESEPDAAFALNATAVGILARACDERRVPVCHISTDFVFDGTKAQRVLGITYTPVRAAIEEMVAQLRAATPRE